MNDKVIYQVCDALRMTGLAPSELFKVALQLLTWAKLSSGGRLPEGLRLSDALNCPPGHEFGPMEALANVDDVMRQAFSGIKPFGRTDLPNLRHAMDLAHRMGDSGLLNTIGADDLLLAGDKWIIGESNILSAELADLLVHLLSPCKGESVYTPWDDSGQLASRMALLGAEVYAECPRTSPIPALVRLLTDVQFEFRHSDPIRSPSAVSDGKLIRFDRALAFPPMGLRIEFEAVERDWFGRFPERTQAITVLAARHLLSQARDRVVLVAPNSLLFSPGAEQALRRDLVERGMLRAVIALPAGLLTNTNIAVSILVLEPTGKHDHVRFVNADAPAFREALPKTRVRLKNEKTLAKLALGSEPSDEAASIPVSDIIANDAQLQVTRYVLPDATKRLQSQLAASPTVELAELVSTVRPMPTGTDHDDVVEAMEVGAADLPAVGYIQKPGKVVKVARDIATKNRAQFLKPHDIVLIIKGSVGKVGIVPPDAPPPGPRGWIAGQSATVLRVNEQSAISAPVLAMQLRSAFGQELLSSIVSGASIPLIRLNELLRLSVILPQSELTERATHALEEEAKLQRQIDELRRQQIALACDLWPLS